MGEEVITESPEESAGPEMTLETKMTEEPAENEAVLETPVIEEIDVPVVEEKVENTIEFETPMMEGADEAMPADEPLTFEEAAEVPVIEETAGEIIDNEEVDAGENAETGMEIESSVVEPIETVTEPEFSEAALETTGENEIVLSEEEELVKVEEPPEIEIITAEEGLAEAQPIEQQAAEVLEKPEMLTDNAIEEKSDEFFEPPQKLSSICTVEDYSRVAFDLAKNSLNINKLFVLEKKGDNFNSIMGKGFSINELSLKNSDPIYQLFLSKKKSVDIKGNIKNTRYLQERFPINELDNVEEVLIVPIIKFNEIDGIALYAREKGTEEPSNFQKSEIFNLGFLQES